ncbi:hypothetical protein [Zunongwangia endophytica]|uniref:DUF4258 domain-containing protein n=1 Tax=Zunongwangia endophytica TaxID=1808945 RepID=A0ABV8H522_9FLAO|nr:hypothetical protein [Zunongwangia endophytica]MDN3594509.1 hypothetical protein [Zunongwangia endophytica]
MNLFQRLGYFSVGLFMGIVILIFFLSGKKTSCSYFPNARTLKNIRTKERQFDKKAISFFSKNSIDTSNVSAILEDGDVHFKESITDKDSCNIYLISGETTKKPIQFKVENCDSIAKIYDVDFYSED